MALSCYSSIHRIKNQHLRCIYMTTLWKKRFQRFQAVEGSPNNIHEKRKIKSLISRPTIYLFGTHLLYLRATKTNRAKRQALFWEALK